MKWASLGTGKMWALRTSSIGKQSKELDDELGAQFKRPYETASSSTSTQAPFARRAPPPVKLSPKSVLLATQYNEGPEFLESLPMLPLVGGKSCTSDSSTRPSSLCTDQRGLHSNSVHSKSSYTSHTSNKKSQSSRKSKTKKPRSGNEKAPQDDDDDDASNTSQDSHTSHTSVFSASYIKLKGYLPRRKQADLDRKYHGSPRTNGSRKQPKYRPNKPTSQFASASVSSSGSPSLPVARRVGWSDCNNESKSPLPTPHESFDNMLVLEEPYSITAEPKSAHPSRNSSAKKAQSSEAISANDNPSSRNSATEFSDTHPSRNIGAKVKQSSEVNLVSSNPSSRNSVMKVSDTPAPSTYPSSYISIEEVDTGSPTAGQPLISTRNDGATQVYGLHWTDHVSGGKLRGMYSGPVTIQPHGEGSLVLLGKDSLKFHGRWENGELATPLIHVDDHSRSQDNARSNTKCSEKSSSGELCKNDSFQGCKTQITANASNSDSKEDSDVSYDDHSKRSYLRRSSQCSVVSDYSNAISAHSKLVYGILDIPATGPRGHMPEKPSIGITNSPPKQNYKLGEIARTPRDMLIYRSSDMATHAASLLKEHDKAFLKRSNGVWTCAMIADRSFQPKGTPSTRSHWVAKNEIEDDSAELEESMLFVINEDGATKIVKKKYWGKFVRCFQTHDDDEEETQANKKTGSASPKRRAKPYPKQYHRISV